MKRLVILVGIVSAGILTGTVVFRQRSDTTTKAAAEPVAEAVSEQPSEVTLPERPRVVVHEAPKPVGTEATQELARAERQVKASADAVRMNQAIGILVSAQTSHGQKEAVWKELAASGKLDAAINHLEERMAAEPRVAEYPATLGQAYLKKCATLQDVREQGILGMQADKLFDVALELDPSNWEARFTKAVAFSFWPASMNKSGEAIEHFQILIQQQEAQAAQPHFAESYVWLGEQYQKAGRSDYARTVWERGANLFPSHDVLKKKVAAASSGQSLAGKQ